MEAVNKKSQSGLCFLGKLRSFNICKPLLCFFCKTVVASVLYLGGVCWGVGVRTFDRNRLNKQINKPSAVICITQHCWAGA